MVIIFEQDGRMHAVRCENIETIQTGKDRETAESVTLFVTKGGERRYLLGHVAESFWNAYIDWAYGTDKARYAVSSGEYTGKTSKTMIWPELYS